MLTSVYPWIVFVHVAAAFACVLAHGVAVFIGFRIRRERDRARIAAMLDLSTASGPMMYASLLILVVTGLAAAAIGGWFAQAWVWTAFAILVLVSVAMSLIASRHYLQVRHLVGASLPARQVRDLEPLGDAERRGGAGRAAAVTRSRGDGRDRGRRPARGDLPDGRQAVLTDPAAPPLRTPPDPEGRPAAGRRSRDRRAAGARA